MWHMRARIVAARRAQTGGRERRSGCVRVSWQDNAIAPVSCGATRLRVPVWLRPTLAVSA